MSARSSVLVLSRSAPPRSGGTPSVLANQCSWIELDFVFVGQRPGGRETKRNLLEDWHAYGVPPIRYTRLPGLQWLWLPVILTAGWRAIRRHKCRAIVLVLFDSQYVSAGYLLAVFSRLPLVLYAADLWADFTPRSASRATIWFRACLENAVVRRAAAHVTNIPGIATVLQKKYGIPVAVVSNCYPRGVKPKDPERLPARQKEAAFRIGFCGSVYWNNADRLAALCAATSGLPDTEVVIFGSQSIQQLRALGLECERLAVRFVPTPAALIDALSECDLVYLPFTFAVDDSYRLVASIAFPTKVLDYLASGRPILLNCPENSDLVSFFRGAEAAEVLTDPSVEALRATILRLQRDASLCEELARRSHDLAKRFMGPEPVAAFDDALRRLVSESGAA